MIAVCTKEKDVTFSKGAKSANGISFKYLVKSKTELSVSFSVHPLQLDG